MTTLQSQAREAVVALYSEWDGNVDSPIGMALRVLQQVLDREQQSKPVAWIRKDHTHVDLHKHPGYDPLYTTAQPVPLVDQVIKALSEYCETGEIDCADDLLAGVLYERDYPLNN